MKPSGHKLYAGVPIALALAASVVFAQPGQHAPPTGCVDPIPADKQSKLLEKFGDKGIDANKDGKLTCDEVKAFFQAHPELRHHGWHGGPCTDPIPQDKQDALMKRFGDKGIDANKDGKLTCDEVKAFFQAHPELRPHHGWHGGPPPCTDPIPADKQAKLLEEFGDKGIDANKDGKLTCDEVKAFFQAHPELRPHHGWHGGPCTDPIPADKQAELMKRFGDQGIDANKDGTLTCDEVKAFFSAKFGGKKGCHSEKGAAGNHNSQGATAH